MQIYGVKKIGGTKKAVNGSIIGLIIGIFFLPPFGIIIGPFLGAFIGARMEENSDVNKAIKIADVQELGDVMIDQLSNLFSKKTLRSLN